MTNSLAKSDLVVLLARTADGNAAAVQQFYSQTSATLVGIVIRILHEQGAIEDVLLDVYVTVWRKAHYDADLTSPPTWIVVIACNRTIDRLRACVEPPFVSVRHHEGILEERTVGDSPVHAGTDAKHIQSALAMMAFATLIGRPNFANVDFELRMLNTPAKVEALLVEKAIDVQP